MPPSLLTLGCKAWVYSPVFAAPAEKTLRFSFMIMIPRLPLVCIGCLGQTWSVTPPSGNPHWGCHFHSNPLVPQHLGSVWVCYDLGSEIEHWFQRSDLENNNKQQQTTTNPAPLLWSSRGAGLSSQINREGIGRWFWSEDPAVGSWERQKGLAVGIGHGKQMSLLLCMVR